MNPGCRTSASSTGAEGTRNGAAPTEASASDEEMERIVAEEERVLARVLRTLSQSRQATAASTADYDRELIALRDQILEARAEDIPPLVEEMERLQQVAARRSQVTHGVVDPASPYFGRLVLEEDERKREVLIGRSTFLDSKTGIRIVDWRDAPVSRIYYRYEEGDDYEEEFGGRDVEGDVLVRRSLGISLGMLKRIGSPQGSFVRTASGEWRRASEDAMRLHGGQGKALRPEQHHRPGKLGIGDADMREDRHLADITALIDPRQFEVITRPTSGLVVIQGGAGSGKTTIGLHRLAYLAFQDRERFKSSAMMVLVFNDALVRYIDRVLPALGVHGVPVLSYEGWARRLRIRQFPHLQAESTEETPTVVTRFKKHPILLHAIENLAASIAAEVDHALTDLAKTLEGGAPVIRAWRETEGGAPVWRLRRLRRWLRDGAQRALPLSTRHAVERLVREMRDKYGDVTSLWADLLTQRDMLRDTFTANAPDALSERELEWVLSWCSRRCDSVLADQERRRDAERDGRPLEPPKDDDDGHAQEELEAARLDDEDDALLLHLHQRVVGRLSDERGPLSYEHVFVDETQDLSPVELSVVLDTLSPARSVTLAGDVAQKVLMDNGFTDWKSVLDHLGFESVHIEPLQLSYRSTHEILELATEVLGPLRNEVSGQATRHGAEVELFRFFEAGEAVGFLGEALRELVASEPLASVAVIARYPEQADIYHRGLQHSEVPRLRRVADQDFSFRPGVDVTDVRQVKGLEFDYVVIVEASAASYGTDNEARHLLHIAATRAAHQLWITTTGSPSPILPESLRATV